MTRTSTELGRVSQGSPDTRESGMKLTGRACLLRIEGKGGELKVKGGRC